MPLSPEDRSSLIEKYQPNFAVLKVVFLSSVVVLLISQFEMEKRAREINTIPVLDSSTELLSDKTDFDHSVDTQLLVWGIIYCLSITSITSVMIIAKERRAAGNYILHENHKNESFAPLANTTDHIILLCRALRGKPLKLKAVLKPLTAQSVKSEIDEKIVSPLF